MKKTYLKPTFHATKFLTTSICATSIPTSGETDDEARSSKFWGETPWDGANDEEPQNDSWY